MAPVEGFDGLILTFHNRGIPYFVRQHMRFGLPNKQQEVTVHAGVHMLFAPKTGIETGFRNDHTWLRLLGTPEDPIVLTSSEGTRPGSWRGVIVGGGTTTNSRMEHVRVAYAGADGRPGLLLGKTMAVQGVTIDGSAGSPLEVHRTASPYGGANRVIARAGDVDRTTIPERLSIDFVEAPPERSAALEASKEDPRVIAMQDLPDGVVLDLDGPTLVGAGQLERFRFYVENRHPKNPMPGMDVAVSFCEGGRLRSCKEVLRSSIPRLGGGAHAPRQEMWVPIPRGRTGIHGVVVSLDPDGRVAEYEEGNNQVARLFTITDKPNLVVDRVQVNHPVILLGQTLRVTATIHNAGVVDAVASSASFGICNPGGICTTVDERIPTPALARGATHTLTYDYALPANAQLGAYTATVRTDHREVVTEYQERDNERGTGFNIAPPLGAEVTATYDAGRLTMSVKNDSPEPMLDGINLCAQVVGSTRPPRCATVGTHLARGTTSVGLSYPQPSGSRIRVWVTFGNSDDEATDRRADNERMLTVP